MIRLDRPRRRATTAVAAALAASFAALAGCSHHPPPQVAASPAAPQTPAPSRPVHSAAWQDSVARARAAADRRAADEARAAADRALSKMVFFDFDQAVLSDSDRALLDAKLAQMQRSRALRIRIAGNCDDRGSNEYNLALGQRRAATAKRYLVDRGIDPSRIETISYGLEKPIAKGENEQAWALDRNDQFIVIGGLSSAGG